MASFKIVISNKEGRSLQKEVTDPNARNLIGKKIGEVIKGELIGMAGYEFMVTGGSDYCGFPMRKDVSGMGRKRIFSVRGVGIKSTGKGQRQRKTVCGNTIHLRISQINLKILKEGKESLFEGKAGARQKGKKAAEEKEETEKAVEKEKQQKDKTEDKKA